MRTNLGWDTSSYARAILRTREAAPEDAGEECYSLHVFHVLISALFRSPWVSNHLLQ